MKKILSLFIICTLLAPSLPVYAANAKASVPQIIAELEDTGSLYAKQCLPKNVKPENIEEYHKKNGISEKCWQMITKINHLESELQKHKAELEAKNGCEAGNCKEKQPGEISNQLNDLAKVKPDLMCTAEKMQEVRKTCDSDLTCVMAASITGPLGPLFNKLPAVAKPKNCDMTDDNCGIQLFTSFFKAAVTFFKGSWELLKMAGGAIGDGVKNLWEKVAGPEDHSSTAQLALAKASEDKGFFDQLTNDFPGTMNKIWQTFVTATKEWIKNDVFCQSWSGTPHFSKCLKPSDSFDCIPCKTLVTGLCTVSGTLVAEIVPAFLTGGIFTAIKHGAKGAASMAKLFKVSDKSMEAIKASRIGKIAVDGTTTTVSVAGKVGSASLSAIQKFLLNPARKVLKASFTAITNLMKTGSPTLAVSPIGKVLSFAGTTLKTTVKVVIYPIDNPMTAMAYKAGGRTFEKALTLGKPKLAAQTAVTTSLLTRQPEVESLLVKLEEAKALPKVDEVKVTALEKQLLEKVEPIRLEAARAALADEKVDLSEVIKRLYPELQYGRLAKTLPKEKVVEAEKQLYLEIAKVSDTNHRAALLKKFEAHVGDGIARTRVVGDVKPPHVAPKLERTAALENYNKPLTVPDAEVKKSIREFMDKNYDEMVDKSRKVEEKLRTSAPVVYDTVAVGAGPKNAILVGALKETNPNLNVLVIESTDSLGTFHRVKGFDINSAEWIGDSGNAFPTSSVHLRDFNINQSAYATAEELGHATQATWQIADPDMLLKTAVTKVSKEPSPGAWPAKYKIETDNGLTVYARSTVVTPGLGASVNRLKDTASVATVKKYEEAAKKVDLLKDAAYAPRFQDVEQLLTQAVKDQKLGRDPMARYKGKTVLIAGANDGANIGVEGLMGINKTLNPSGAATDIKTVWLGQEASTKEEFLKGLSRAKQPRYGRIGDAFEQGNLKSVNGYLSKVEEFVNEAGETQFKVYYTSKKGDLIGDPVIVDNVVFATGYTHSHKTIAPYFESMAKAGNAKGDEVAFVPLHGKLNDFSRYDGLKTQSAAEINKQLVVNGQAEDIYLTGLGGKTPISKRKMKTVTGGFLDIAGARAAATGQHIAQSLAPQTLTRTKMVQMLTPQKGESAINYIKRPVRSDINLPNKAVVNISNKIELGKSLRTFKSKPDSKFFVSVMNNEKGEMVFTVNGLDQKSSKAIVDTLADNPRLVQGLSKELDVNGNRVDIMIPSRATGSISNESIQMRTVNIYEKNPIEATSRWPSAVLKIVSPTLKAAGQDKKEEKKE